MALAENSESNIFPENAVPLANWNGQEMPLDEVRVSVLDRAFLFGDAVYEALRVYSGKAWLCAEHMARLQRSLQEMQIDCNLDQLQEKMLSTLDHSGVDDGLIYLQITRGVAARTHYFPPEPTTPNELIYVQKFDSDPLTHLRESGAAVVTFPDFRWGRRDIKSVNLLANCFAAQAAREADCTEAILVTPDGRMTEGSHTNLFGVKNGKVMTSPKGHHILPGITRGLVLRLAERAAVPVIEEPLLAEKLHEVDELFLTGTTTEILAVSSVDGNSIGSGICGPITEILYQAYKDSVAEWLEAQP